jgi:hypothetical protein
MIPALSDGVPSATAASDGGEAVATALLHSLTAARQENSPFRHWRLDAALPAGTVAAIVALPFAPSAEAAPGRREIVNSTRIFFSAENNARFAVCRDVAEALQSAIVDRLARLCGTDLAGSYLRIEYCQDTDGFWLEPHTDIGAKLFTMLVYLSTEREAKDWGTDLMNPAGDVIATVPWSANRGLMFVPGSDTWHGFRKRRIEGVRRSLVVNYVKPEWRSRHELAFPDRPVA